MRPLAAARYSKGCVRRRRRRREREGGRERGSVCVVVRVGVMVSTVLGRVVVVSVLVIC